MTGGELKHKVTQGVAWSVAEKIGTTAMQMAVSLIILRFLTREIIGFTAIPTAIVAMALVFVDSGFSQALIRKAKVSQAELKSVFAFNIVVAVALYAILVATSSAVAHFYEIEAIAQIAPIFLLQLPLSALCSVQNTILIREFRFSQLSKITFLASLLSGVTAIAMAVAGYGIWSIVAQRVLLIALRAALLWWLSEWRARGAFEWRSLRAMAPFSGSVMATDLISNLYNKIPQLFIGKLYPATTLGSFEQAIKLKDQPVLSLTQSIQNVTYPALSKIRDDKAKFAESYRQIIMLTSYVIFPIMLGLSATAHNLFEFLLGEEWMPTAPYFEVVCLAGLLYPISMVAYNVLKTGGEGRAIVRAEVIKRVAMTAIFIATIPHSIEAVVWGLVAISVVEMAINFVASQRYTTLSVGRLLRTLLPIIATSGAMYVGARYTAFVLDSQSAAVALIAQIVVGVAIFLLLSAIFRLEAFREIVAIAKCHLKGDRCQ